ncbi:hypothetical protein U1Q18_013078, partial [Sarracenia purpurea var. burkii]
RRNLVFVTGFESKMDETSYSSLSPDLRVTREDKSHGGIRVGKTRAMGVDERRRQTGETGDRSARGPS